MEQSPELTKFYRAYKKWLDKGAPNKEPFFRNDGLCDNLMLYGAADRVELRREMQYQFMQADLDAIYPFNEGDHATFVREHHAEAMHLNPKRVQWVREHCNG